MDVLVERCAGLDVHRDTVVATVRVPGKGKRRSQQTGRFGTTIGELERLRDWLAGFEVTLVGMEATGVDWRPVWHVLEERFSCWLLNAQHLHHVPGRKTDVIDSAWICRLLEHGLVRPSFVPPLEIRRLRDLTRLRRQESEERTRAIQRLERVLQDAGIKLTSVASNAFSVSARAMLEALLAGTADADALAELARGRMRAKIPRLREALRNRFELTHHGVLVAALLAHIDAVEAAIARLDARIETALAPHAGIVELLCTIPGVGRHTAQVLIAECGLDMSVFPSPGHFASWAKICPGTRESAGKPRPAPTGHGSQSLRTALTEAAWAAARTRDTYLAARFAQLRARRGEQKAIAAIRHDILLAYYHIVARQTPFRELGPEWVGRRHSPEHRARRLVRQLEALGLTVNVEATA
jgi:transposase